MIPYSPVQLLFFFFVYCFIGWIIESTWVSSHQKRFVNRGFMRGPFIPIYGFGAMALLISCVNLLKWPVAVFFVGMTAASILEYFTGVAMEAIFKVRYWDYSNNFLNINGHVCLFTSLAWGALAVAENYLLHKPIEKLSVIIPNKALNLITAAISVYFIVDLTLSFKAAFDLRDLIIKLEKVKDDIRIIQKRMDVLIACAGDDYEKQKERLEAKISEIQSEVEERADLTKMRLEELSDSVEEKFEAFRIAMEEKPQAFAESMREEYRALREKYAGQKAEHFGIQNIKGFYKRGIFVGNPGIVSKKFKDTVETVKKYVLEKK